MSNKSDETRASILESAREVFVEDGFEQASMRKVAHRAGITHGTIYLHFRDKDDLFYQVSEEQFRVLLDRLRGLPRTLDPVNRTIAALHTFAAYGLDFPNHYELLFEMPPAWRAGRREHRFGPMAEEVHAYIRESVEVANARKQLTTNDLELDTFVLIAALHGVIDLHRLALIDRSHAEASVERLVRLLVGSLSPRDACSRIRV